MFYIVQVLKSENELPFSEERNALISNIQLICNFLQLNIGMSRECVYGYECTGDVYDIMIGR